MEERKEAEEKLEMVKIEFGDQQELTAKLLEKTFTAFINASMIIARDEIIKQLIERVKELEEENERLKQLVIELKSKGAKRRKRKS